MTAAPRRLDQLVWAGVDHQVDPDLASTASVVEAQTSPARTGRAR